MRNYYIRQYLPQIIEEYFILFVFLSDGYFICANLGEDPLVRFSKIVIVLSQELQALIANRMVDSLAIRKFLIKKLIIY
jgi:hypothetical protein